MREHESPSGLAKLLSCPLQWALQYHGRLSTGAADGPAPPSPLLYGNLAHHILERVLSEWPLTPEHAKERATTLFDEEAPRLAEALFLPRHGAQRADVRHRIIQAAEAVIRLLERNGTAVEAVETSYERNLEDMKLRGRIDLLTQTPSLVIDWKWGSGSYVKHLRQGTALQLAAYAYLTTNGHGRPKAGYFSISSGELHMESGADLEHANTQGSYTMDDTWDAALVLLKARRDELSASVVHAPGAETPPGKPGKDQLKDGELTLAPQCNYCAFPAVCGKDFVK
jgi:RecB family exonuclease